VGSKIIEEGDRVVRHLIELECPRRPVKRTLPERRGHLAAVHNAGKHSPELMKLTIKLDKRRESVLKVIIRYHEIGNLLD